MKIRIRLKIIPRAIEIIDETYKSPSDWRESGKGLLDALVRDDDDTILEEHRKIRRV